MGHSVDLDDARVNQDMLKISEEGYRKGIRKGVGDYQIVGKVEYRRRSTLRPTIAAVLASTQVISSACVM